MLVLCQAHPNHQIHPKDPSKHYSGGFASLPTLDLCSIWRLFGDSPPGRVRETPVSLVTSAGTADDLMLKQSSSPRDSRASRASL